jgi:3-dehydroquinate synthase
VKLPGKIEVPVAGHRYWVTYLDQIADLSTTIKTERSQFVLIDSTVDRLHGKAFRRALKGAQFLVIKAGEKSKSFAALETIAEQLVKLGANRSSELIAIGGGMVGDLTGFLAGIFMRGIPFVQVPTTLLAMVDSSVGGKTAVNLKAGKNLAGVFHQPRAVYIIPSVLETLPARELKCGLAEAIKTALISENDFVTELERHSFALAAGSTELKAMVSAACITVKAAIVVQDEREQSIRAFLNFGHTLAHALEAQAGYKGILHGEAVAIGMRFAALLSRRLGYLTQADEQRITNLLAQYELPSTLADYLRLTRQKTAPQPKKLIELMRSDKKNKGKAIRFVLLNAPGEARLPEPVPEQELLASLKEFQALVKDERGR